MGPKKAFDIGKITPHNSASSLLTRSNAVKKIELSAWPGNSFLCENVLM